MSESGSVSIEVENEESARNIVEIKGLPSKTKDTIPTNIKKENATFAFRDDEDSDADVESLKSAGQFKKSGVNNFKSNNSNFKHSNEMFSMYADPKKIVKQKQEDSELEDDEDEYSDEDSEVDDSGAGEDGYSELEDSEAGESYKRSDNKNLSKARLKIKKKEMLLKLYDAEQSGYQLTGKYNMSSDLDDMEAEYEIYQKRMGQTDWVDFLNYALLSFIKGLETLTNFYNPLGLKLQGLSNSIYESKEKLDYSFKRLAEKYAGGKEMPPELSILFIVGGAILMTHMSNTILSKDNLPGILDTVMEKVGGSSGISNFMNNFMQGMQQNNTPVPSNAPSPQIQPQQMNPQQTMKAPNFDISNLLSNMKDVTPSKPVDPRDALPFSTIGIPTPSPFPVSTSKKDVKPQFKEEDDNDRFSVSSSTTSGSSVQTRTVSVANKSVGSRKSFGKNFKSKKKNILSI